MEKCEHQFGHYGFVCQKCGYDTRPEIEAKLRKSRAVHRPWGSLNGYGPENYAVVSRRDMLRDRQ